ncbi:hypothetical protein [Salimicrobium flavidum]|uniref:Uncharacterized protein n=1 Tax=Salimicrobium flavidum TaxID=570947 RepID=A0A1N7ISL8_9BACI|nr:hypothetical protein [Salimicrobium flavidum]SIS39951.1 hypothetical protein SAMN05421687_10292 [Salimicrobium flavidum]
MRKFFAGIVLSISIIGSSVTGASAEESNGEEFQHPDHHIIIVSDSSITPPIVKPFSEELPPGN